MQIELRFQKIRTKRILKTTARRKTVKYAPREVAASARPARRPEGYTITFGFQPPGEEHLYGVMLYHHNRLIIPYYRIGVQLQPNKDGLGVLGVIEADFLDPTHNKQDFDDNQAWRRLLASLAEKLNMFWYEDVALRQAQEAEMRETPARVPKKRLSVRDAANPQTIAQMNALLNQLWSHPHSEAFIKLVSRKLFPDYYVLIKKPIALEQIKQKIGKAQYRTMKEMQKDVLLMCANAKTYNQDGSPLYMQAMRLEKMTAEFVAQAEVASSSSLSPRGDGTSGDCAISLDDDASSDSDGSDSEADVWVQCDNVDCQKWRKLPFGTSLGDTDADWFCHMNPDPRYNSCDIPEHKEEEATVKQHSQYKVDPVKQAQRLEKARRQREEQERAAAREMENQKLREQLANEKLKAAEAQAAAATTARARERLLLQQQQQQPQPAAAHERLQQSAPVLQPQQSRAQAAVAPSVGPKVATIVGPATVSAVRQATVSAVRYQQTQQRLGAPVQQQRLPQEQEQGQGQGQEQSALQQQQPAQQHSTTAGKTLPHQSQKPWQRQRVK